MGLNQLPDTLHIGYTINGARISHRIYIEIDSSHLANCVAHILTILNMADGHLLYFNGRLPFYELFQFIIRSVYDVSTEIVNNDWVTQSTMKLIPNAPSTEITKISFDLQKIIALKKAIISIIWPVLNGWTVIDYQPPGCVWMKALKRPRESFTGISVFEQHFLGLLYCPGKPYPDTSDGEVMYVVNEEMVEDTKINEFC